MRREKLGEFTPSSKWTHLMHLLPRWDSMVLARNGMELVARGRYSSGVIIERFKLLSPFDWNHAKHVHTRAWTYK